MSAFAPQKHVLLPGKPRTYFCEAKADTVALRPNAKLVKGNPKCERGTLLPHRPSSHERGHHRSSSGKRRSGFGVRDFEDLEGDLSLGNADLDLVTDFLAEQTLANRACDEVLPGVVVLLTRAHERE